MARSPEDEELGYDSAEDDDENEPDEPSGPSEDDMEGLSEREKKEVDEGRKTIPEIEQERKRLAEKNIKRLRKLLNEKQIGEHHWKRMMARIENTRSAEHMAELIPKEIDEIEEAAAEEREQEERDKTDLFKLRDPEDKELKKITERLREAAQDNAFLIGTKQIKDFQNHFDKERQKKPTLAHLHEMEKRFFGEIKDEKGLYPRIEVYEDLAALGAEYGVKNPLQSSYVKREGLKERRQFLKNAQQIESALLSPGDTGLQNDDVTEHFMQQALTADSPLAQQKILSKLKTMISAEATGISYMDETIQVNGVKVRKISEDSKDLIISNQAKITDPDKRIQNAKGWRTLIIDAEAKLYQDFAKIYKDDPDSFKQYIRGFESLTYQEKKDSLKTHEKLRKEKISEDKKRVTVAISASISKINSSPDLSKKTKKRYIDFFRDESNYQNSETKEADPEKAEEIFDILKSKKADHDARNLAAYAENRQKFQKDLRKLKKAYLINSRFEDSQTEAEHKKTLSDLETRFEEEGYENRNQIHEELNTILTEEDALAKTHQSAREKLKDNSEDEKAVKEGNENADFNKEIGRVQECLDEENPKGEQALEILIQLLKSHPEKRKIISFWITTVGNFIEKFGTEARGELAADESEKEIERTASSVTSSENIQDRLEELQRMQESVEATKQSEQLQKKGDTSERAATIAREQTAGESEEVQELTEQYLEESGDDITLNEDLTGADIAEMEMSSDMQTEEEDLVDDVLDEDEDKIRSGGGTARIRLTNQGEEIQSGQAEKMLENEENKLKDEIADETLRKAKGLRGSDDAFSLSEELAARRAAKKEIEEAA